MNRNINSKIELLFARMSRKIFEVAKQSSMSKTEQAGLCHLLCGALDSVERDVRNIYETSRAEDIARHHLPLDRYSENSIGSIVHDVELLIAGHFELTGLSPWGVLMSEAHYKEFKAEFADQDAPQAFGFIDTFKGCKIIVSDKVNEVLLINRSKKEKA